jgi:2'-5' RNA ligase
VTGSRSAQARLFAAIELPASIRGMLVAWAREAARALGAARAGSGLRVLDEDSLHLTLSFLGDRPLEEVGELVELLGSACQGTAALELAPGAPVWLPPRRPRALAVEVHDASGALAALQERVEGALGGPGSREGRRRYRPHVTVARTGAGFQPGRRALPVTPAEGFAAGTVCLMRSWLEPEGARYESQGRAMLEETAG